MEMDNKNLKGGWELVPPEISKQLQKMKWIPVYRDKDGNYFTGKPEYRPGRLNEQ